jgi:hypothetical protein
VFGPVPAKYSFIVWFSGLAVFAGLGAWVSPALPLSAASMAALGLSLGVVVVAAFLHDFEHARARTTTRRRLG